MFLHFVGQESEELVGNAVWSSTFICFSFLRVSFSSSYWIPRSKGVLQGYFASTKW